ncbi:MAG: thiamine-phosphate kinase [Rikenellaceae bacterium]|nr:thiamine-phosphate kinase [Rikenellaceae bacterium]MCL2691851.1 thiamine-phosphate kinase [Rikenellaceae bacterium]
MTDKKHTEIITVGKENLIERLTGGFEMRQTTTVAGVGDDAAVVARDDENYTLFSTDLLLEGVNFDLVYFPLKHLGYKAVVVGCSDILAMNGRAEQLTLALGISSKFSVERLEEFYAGARAACEDLGVDLVGGDLKSSVTGLVISISALGSVARERLVRRSGAQPNDLICVTGDLGAAYMGLHLLEREKRAFDGHPSPQPSFEGYEYLLRRQLMPAARRDVIESLADAGLVPTSMIDLSDGLAADLLRICRSSQCGARIYLDKLPIARETYALAEELNADPVVAALNGGDDHELLFTVPLSARETVARIGGIDIIGHITPDGTGAFLVTPDGAEVQITTP